MNEVTSRAFLDELEKIAFSPEDARKMLRAAKKVGVKAGKRMGLGYGMIPSKKFVSRERQGVLHQLAERGVPKETATKAITNLKRQQLAAAGGALDDPEAWARAKKFMITPEKGDFKRGIQQMGIPGAEAIKTPQQRMMAEALIKGHELAELAATKRPMQSFRGVGHLSPEVILKEHNMLTTMPKGIKKGLSPVMQTMRGPGGQGEATALKEYGVNYGKGQRLSRHARKRIAQMIEEDVQPELEAGFDALARIAPQLARG